MIIVITGPTCTSKSKIALEVAKAIDGEIVNADAFQIYQDLNIGTAKPSLNDMKLLPHHLYNFIKANQSYSIYDYQKDARKCIDNILKRNKTVILVGGSGLYIRAALYDYTFSKSNNEVDLSYLENLSNEELHERLKVVDPKEAKKIHPNNRRRVLRALNIYYIYGKSKSDLEALQEHKIIYSNVHIYAILLDKNILYKNINDRAEAMIANGLVKEVSDLVKKYGPDVQSLKAIGYREIVQNPSLETNEITKLIQKDTRNYAKRQMTFIRHQYGDDFKWVQNANDILEDISSSSINDRSIALLGLKKFKKIKKTSVAIFGIGGVGGTAAEALLRSGVEKIHLVDFDRVSASNLNRQILFTHSDIDTAKVKAAKKRFEAINPDAKVMTYNYFVDQDSLNSFPFEKIDYVIDAIDSTKSKVALIEYLLKKKIPFVSSLGMGNRNDIAKLKITTLDKTHDDPLAKKIRDELKKDAIDLHKIKVVASDEVPIKNGKVISSMIFVPSAAGLLLANHVLKDIINKED